MTAERDLLVQASRLYYELGETQNAIADRLGVTRPQVSRLLKRARAEGIVEIRIIDRTEAESPAAADLQRRFGLDAVHLAPTLSGPEDLTRRMVGRLAAQVLRAAFATARSSGSATGRRSRRWPTRSTTASRRSGATVVPLAGGYWSPGPEREPFRRIADALGAQPHGLMAPGCSTTPPPSAPSRRTPASARSSTCGTGSTSRCSGSAAARGARRRVGAEVARDLDAAEAVGEILIAPFDLRGRSSARSCASGSSRSMRGRSAGCPVSIGVAAGERKVLPILGALRSGAVRTLVTDVATAEAVADVGRTHDRTPATAILGIDLGTTEVKAGLVGLDGRLLAMARAGYGLDVGRRAGLGGAGPGGVVGRGGRRGPGAPAARARRRRRDRRRRPRPDARGRRRARRGDPSGDHLPRHPRRRPRRTSWKPRPASAAGPSDRCRPRSGSSATSLQAAERTRWYLTTWEWLAFRLTGEAVAPLVPGQAVPDPAAVTTATGLAIDRRPPPAAMGAIVGGLHRSRRRRARPAAGHPGRRRHQRRLRELSRRRPDPRPGDAYDPGGSAGGFGVYWHEPVEVAGAFVTPAPLEGLYSVGAAMAATGRALDWFRDDILGGRVTTERLLEEAATTPPGADGLVFLPYLAGERSPIWDPTATGAFAGLTLAHGRGHLARAILEASALAIRHVADADARGRRDRHRDAGVRRPGPKRDVEPDQGRRHRLPRSSCRPCSRRPSSARRSSARSASAPAPTCRRRIRSMTRIERRLEPRPEVRATYDRAFDGVRRASTRRWPRCSRVPR